VQLTLTAQRPRLEHERTAADGMEVDQDASLARAETPEEGEI